MFREILIKELINWARNDIFLFKRTLNTMYYFSASSAHLIAIAKGWNKIHSIFTFIKESATSLKFKMSRIFTFWVSLPPHFLSVRFSSSLIDSNICVNFLKHKTRRHTRWSPEKRSFRWRLEHRTHHSSRSALHLNCSQSIAAWFEKF